ncbi:XkdX family protein [Latilactobacillus sakei]|nr:XkdX family protein [Latilactobacillus sakei]AWZ43149.1 XkdX family protein [Latilactobacillus sakei]
MFIVFKFAYQNWNTMNKDDVMAQVVKGSISEEQFKEIVGEDYVAPTN